MSTTISAKKLAIYYGWPSSVNLHYTVPAAAAEFSKYHLVVWGAGLQNGSHPDYANVVAILQHPEMVNVKVFGYINMVDNVETNKTNIDLWAALPNIAGIFGDQFGYDYQISRTIQNELIDYTHAKALSFFANGWNPRDVLGSDIEPTYNPDGVATHLNKKDWVLLESFGLRNGNFEVFDDLQKRGWAYFRYAKDVGVSVATITTANSDPFDQARWDYAYFASLLFGFDAQGFGEPDYSATSALLPFRTRKRFYGNVYSDPVPTVTGYSLQRRTNVGIRLNPTTHTVDFLLDK